MSTNLIANGEFFSLDFWTPWARPNHLGVVVQPVLNIEDVRPPLNSSPLAVYSPPTSLRFVSDHRTWLAGVWQRVTVGAFKRFKVTARGRIYDVEDGVQWPGPSNPAGKRLLVLGIDPTGGTDVESGSVVWKEVGELYDDWKLIAAEELAITNSVTVFVGIENGRDNEWPLATMMGFLDSVTLEVVGETEPPPPPPPSTDRIKGVITESVEEVGDWFKVVQWWPKGRPVP